MTTHIGDQVLGVAYLRYKKGSKISTQAHCLTMFVTLKLIKTTNTVFQTSSY